MTSLIKEKDGRLAGPGLMDIHTHGFGGVDAISGKGAALHMAGGLIAHGVTAFLPALATAEPDVMSAALADIAACMEKQRAGQAGGSRILGAHIEGVFFSRTYRGAHRAELLRAPTVENYRRIAGANEDIVRRVSLAPELPGALELIAYLRSRGVQASIAHTEATYDEAKAAADVGATTATHLFNGMRPLHHREPGALGFALTDDRVVCELIADGVHTHPAILALAARAKGPDGVCLVSDAVAAAGLGDGEYVMGAEKITVREGVARIAEGNLAGSTLALDEAVRRMSRLAGIPFSDALSMASAVPARVLGTSPVGECEWTPDFRPCRVTIDGRSIWSL